jgi:soluble lytic murein transglycosylase-like protein
MSSSPPPTPTPTGDPATGGAAFPQPDQPIPSEPGLLAGSLVSTTQTLRTAIDQWLSGVGPATDNPSQAVTLLALYQQRIYGLLVARPPLARRTIARLPGWLSIEARANVTAGAELSALTSPISHPAQFRTGRPQPAGVLLRAFKEAERRFGVRWQVLAAVMFVESKFGRTRSASGAGAQGPMQFIPQTWAAYGLGGDINDPHDAILAAANYLHRSGAPGDDRAALFAYNHAQGYVDAVLLYANQMENDPLNYYAYYHWQVFVRTASGVRRVTGPDL